MKLFNPIKSFFKKAKEKIGGIVKTIFKPKVNVEQPKVEEPKVVSKAEEPKVDTKPEKKTERDLSKSKLIRKKKSAPLPVLSDGAIDIFLSEIANAEMYVHPKGNKKWQDAVHNAATKADYEFTSKLTQWVNKTLQEDEVRKKVSKNLTEKWADVYDDLERYLYEFESDQKGNLVHIGDEGDVRLEKLIKIAFDLSDKDFEDLKTKLADDTDDDYDIFKGVYGDEEF